MTTPVLTEADLRTLAQEAAEKTPAKAGEGIRSESAEITKEGGELFADGARIVASFSIGAALGAVVAWLTRSR